MNKDIDLKEGLLGTLDDYFNQIQDLARQIESCQENRHIWISENRKDIKKYYLDLDNYVIRKKCSYPWGNLRINPYGDVYPFLDYFYGNIKDDSFKNLCNNERARLFRSKLKKVKLFPACRRCCKL